MFDFQLADRKPSLQFEGSRVPRHSLAAIPLFAQDLSVSEKRAQGPQSWGSSLPPGWRVGQGTALQFVQLVLPPGARAFPPAPPSGLCPLSFDCLSSSFGSPLFLKGINDARFPLSIASTHTQKGFLLGKINGGILLVTFQGTGQALSHLPRECGFHRPGEDSPPL